VLQQNGNRKFRDSVFRGVEAKGAVFLYTSRVSLTRGFLFALPVLSVDFSPEERERFERSFGFLFPGELVQLASRFSRVGHTLVKCRNASHL